MIAFAISLASFVAGGVLLLAWLLAPTRPAVKPIAVAAANARQRRALTGGRIPDTTNDRTA
jgi:hypothetical protein